MNRYASFALACAITAMAASAQAHARLVSASPANGSTVVSPRAISLTFSERFAGPFSTVEVEDGRGRAVVLTKTVSQDGKTLGGSFSAPLPAGTYRVSWAIAAADGHRMTGNYSFTVR
jgi:methionine-rich copper-binding protein CopC